MAAGRELTEYRDTLSETLSDTRQILRQMEDLNKDLGPAASAALNYQKFRKAVSTVDDFIDYTQQSLKLVGKSSALRPAADALKRILDRLEPRVEDLKEKIEDAKTLNTITDKLVSAKSGTEKMIKGLVTAEAFLDNQLGGVEEVILAFDRVDPPTGPGRRAGAAHVEALFDGVDAEVKPINDLVDGARAVASAYAAANAKVDDFLDVVGLSAFGEINKAMSSVSGLEGLFNVISPVLDVANAILKPIEPLLDAVGFVADLILAPPINFLTKTLGIDALMDRIADEIGGLLPEVTVLDPLIARLPVLTSGLDDFLASNFGVSDFFDLATSVYGEFSRDAVSDRQMMIGDVGDETLRNGDVDAVIDPRGGDDTVYAGGGNDILIASEGDDFVDGGDGVGDRLVMAGELVEYDFARNEDTGALIFTHTDPGFGRQIEGSESAVNIEFFDFGTETFTKAQLEAAIVGPSILNGTSAGDLIFLQASGTLVNGRYVANGLGGDDRIQGTLMADLLNGGLGDDLLIPRVGNDSLNGGPGSDSYQIFDLGFRTQDRIDLGAGTAAVRGGDVTLRSVENVIIQHKGDLEIFGNRAKNLLVSGGGDDVLAGRKGNDTLDAGAGKDFLIGGPGVDALRGGDGNDKLAALGRTSSGRAESYDGGAGLDTLSYSTDADLLLNIDRPTPAIASAVRAAFASAAATTSVHIRAGDGEIDRLNGVGDVVATDRTRSIENFIGSDSDDRLEGALGSYLDPITIDGAGGDDVLISNGATQTIGGAGNDRLVATLARALGEGNTVGFDGGDGQDVLDLRPIGDLRWWLNSQTNSFQRVQAYDRDYIGNLRGGGNVYSASVEGIERLILSRNDDVIDWGSGGQVTIAGGGGDDELRVLSLSGSKFVTMQGQNGADFIRLEDHGVAFGGKGADRIEVDTNAVGGPEIVADGGRGADTVVIERSDGIVRGGRGYDRLVFDPINGGVNVDLGAGTANSTAGSNQVTGLEIQGIEEVVTTALAEALRGGEAGDRLIALGGNDTVEGRAGDDQLYGGAGGDGLFGGDGDDLLNGGTGSDTIVGGDGTDSVAYGFVAPEGAEGVLVAGSFAAVSIDLGTGTATSSLGSDTLREIENAYGTDFDDLIIGGPGANVLAGEAGIDSLFGGGGADLLLLGAGSVVGASGREVANGGGGADRIMVGVAAATVNGGRGSDWIDFGGATDPLDGGGTPVGVDIALASGGYALDYLGARPIWADTGTSEARDFDGQSLTPASVLRVDPFFAVGPGDGLTRLPDSASLDAPRFEITSREVAATANGTFRKIENVAGTGGADSITGNARANQLQGGGGRDVLDGQAGRDRLDGGGGADRVQGGAGNDSLAGGAGSDRFVFGRADGRDVIADFDPRREVIEITAGANGMRALDIEARGDDTVVSFAQTTIRLLDLLPGALDADNFSF